MPAESYFHKLVELMALLRGPEGCPWDREQTRETLKPMLVEEAYEVLEALDGGDAEELCEELGDLLFQVIFHACLAQEKGEFDMEDVCRRSYEKMVGRHPHVFGDESYRDADELLRNWESIKAREREKTSGRSASKKSLLDGVPERLPALYTGYQISSKAARVGFDWEDLEAIRAQVMEEFEELQAALGENDPERVKEEVGDLLFSALNVARRLQVDPETALGRANRKFRRRFRAMEEHFAGQGRVLSEVRPAEMEAFWQQNKRLRDEAGVESGEPR